MTISPINTREHTLTEATECLRIAHLIAAGDETLLTQSARLLGATGESFERAPVRPSPVGASAHAATRSETEASVREETPNEPNDAPSDPAVRTISPHGSGIRRGAPPTKPTTARRGRRTGSIL